MQDLAFLKKDLGFTLTELLVTVAISGIVMAGIAVSFQSQKKYAATQDQIVEMQQNGRAAMQILTNELRLAGYDPLSYNSITATGNFGITDISLYNLAGMQSPPGPLVAPETQSNSGITFSYDRNENGTLDVGEDLDGDGILDAGEDTNGDGLLTQGETISYALYDFPGEIPNVASRDLSRRTDDPIFNILSERLLVENVEAFGLAFAFADLDASCAEVLKTDAAGNVIWAIDDANDGTWDSLDTNADGLIDGNDAPAGTTNGVINAIALQSNFESVPDNCAAVRATTIADVPLSKIRMARIWLLVKSAQQDPEFADTTTYVVGRQVITPSGLPNTQGFRFLLLESTVDFRNMGLQ